MKKKRGLIAAAAVLIVLCIGAGFLYQKSKPSVSEGAKQIKVTVVHGDETENVFEYDTDAEYLGEVLKSEKLWMVKTGNLGCLSQQQTANRQMIPNSSGGALQKPVSRSILLQIRHRLQTEMNLN